MKKFIDVLQEIVEKAFEKSGYDKKYGKLIVSNRPDLCEFQCDGALHAAKEYRKSPIMIAQDVVNVCKEYSEFEKIDAVNPGFINIVVSNDFLTNYCNEMKAVEKFGCQIELDKMVILDYGGPNIAKPLHVGHLRPAVIGESVKRIHRYFGNNVIGDPHLGDWGLQMGLVIEEMKARHPDWPYFDENFTGEYPENAMFTVTDLEEIYPSASKKTKYDENASTEEIEKAEQFKKNAQINTLYLQEEKKGYYDLWKKIVEISIEDLKKNYEKLNVSFDVWLGESDSQKFVKPMIEKMQEMGIIYESDGALVVDVKEDGDKTEINPCMILNSRGASGYQTTDLATIMQREQDYHPDEIIYVVDKRQDLHFTQVFRCAKKAKLINENAKLLFLGNGTMNGQDGKPFKPRNGGVMRLESLISEVNNKVYEKIIDSKEISEEEARDIAEIVGIGALKYADLQNQISKDYIFDIDKFTMFEGNTGPYILYTLVRIKSILRKFAENHVLNQDKLLAPEQDIEKKMYIAVSKCTQMLTESYLENSPSKICGYLYEIADLFNTYYQKVRILDDENEKLESKISLLYLIKNIFETGIDLLGFSAPEKM